MKALFISFTGLGDSVILSKLIEYIAPTKEIQIDVLTNRHCLSFFKNNPYIGNIFLYEKEGEDWPKSRLPRYKRAFATAYKLRKEKYDVVFNNRADSKMRFLGWLMGGKENICIRLGKSHPYRLNDVNIFGFGIFVDRYIDIPDDILNVYEIQKYVAQVFAKTIFPPQTASSNVCESACDDNRNRVGIHPMVSARWRFWIFENWVELIDKIYVKDKILLFCAPGERAKVEVAFAKVLDKTEIVAENIEVFFKKLENVKLFIGLDSFSIHAAYYKDVPQKIMLNGANDARVWAPPNTKIVEKECGCKYRSCYSKPKCLGTSFENACIDAIKVQDVVDAIHSLKYPMKADNS